MEVEERTEEAATGQDIKKHKKRCGDRDCINLSVRRAYNIYYGTIP